MRAGFVELTQLESVELFTSTVISQTVYLNVLFPSKHRYYLEFVSSTETPILIDHPFRLYFPQTILIEWAPPDGTSGIYLTLESSPEFMPFGPLTVRIYIPQAIYDAVVQAFLNPINSPADLVPPVEGNACGEVEFVLLSMDEGEQIKIDLVNTYYVPETPVTVKTLQWHEVLYDVMRLPPSLEFAYTVSGDLGVTFIDPRYCFLREWITLPAFWTEALKDFAGIQ